MWPPRWMHNSNKGSTSFRVKRRASAKLAERVSILRGHRRFIGQLTYITRKDGDPNVPLLEQVPEPVLYCSGTRCSVQQGSRERERWLKRPLVFRVRCSPISKMGNRLR